VAPSRAEFPMNLTEPVANGEGAVRRGVDHPAVEELVPTGGSVAGDDLRGLAQRKGQLAGHPAMTSVIVRYIGADRHGSRPIGAAGQTIDRAPLELLGKPRRLVVAEAELRRGRHGEAERPARPGAALVVLADVTPDRVEAVRRASVDRAAVPDAEPGTCLFGEADRPFEQLAGPGRLRPGRRQREPQATRRATELGVQGRDRMRPAARRPENLPVRVSLPVALGLPPGPAGMLHLGDALAQLLPCPLLALGDRGRRHRKKRQPGPFLAERRDEFPGASRVHVREQRDREPVRPGEQNRQDPRDVGDRHPRQRHHRLVPGQLPQRLGRAVPAQRGQVERRSRQVDVGLGVVVTRLHAPAVTDVGHVS
jgi:hypothetical protein